MKAISPNVISCETKKRFTSYARAERAAHLQARRHKQKFAPYACGLCGGFHVGGLLGHGGRISHPDGRQRFAVYASKNGGDEFLVGWSQKADGGRVAEIIGGEPGWRVTCVVERRRTA